MFSNYPYVCARVKAKKSKLLSPDTYAKMMLMDVAQITRWIGETQYQREITELSLKASGINLVELATYRNMSRTYSEILSFSKGELHTILEEYLRKWDISNVKTIIRGKLYGAPRDEIIEDVVPAGSFDEKFLSSLIDIESTTEIARKAIDKFAGFKEYENLCAACEDFEKSNTPSAIEDALDRAYYLNLLDRVQPTSKPKRMFVDFVKREIDALNVKILFELKYEDAPSDFVEKYLIPDGLELDAKKRERLAAAASFDELAGELSNCSFYDHIKSHISQKGGVAELSLLTSALDRHLLTFSDKFSHSYPLSILPIMSYMLAKKKEVDNIRIISRGKEYGLDTQTIESLVMA